MTVKITDVSGFVVELDPRDGFVAIAVHLSETWIEGCSTFACLTYEQAAELHRKLGDAITDERVRRAELERAKQP